MNKKYTVGEEGHVIIVTDEGETIERGIYTKNTDEILSLENAAESINRKINIFKDRLKEHIENKKIMKNSMVLTPIILILFVAFISLISGSLSIAGTIGLFCIPAGLIVEIRNLISYLKSKNKEATYNQKVIEETQRVNKINKRINTLSQDKTRIERENSVTFTEIKSISDFNFDAADYFVEKYQTDKRSKEMSKGYKKVKKTTKLDNSIYTM